MRAPRTPTAFVLSVLTALALAVTLVLARDGVRRAEAGVPPPLPQINITVTDELKLTPLPNTCWAVGPFPSFTLVDVVSDNNAKPAVCDSQGAGQSGPHGQGPNRRQYSHRHPAGGDRR